VSWLRDPVLGAVPHGFGTRQAAEPAGVVRPRQVHGARVARVRGARADPPEADAIVAPRDAARVGVVTADCVPILAVSADGAWVAAIHAGWRGLAAGVVEAGVEALRAAGGPAPRAALGPCIGVCCYEVDEPVLESLGARYPDALERALRPTRPGHARIDLAGLARHALRAAGVAAPGDAAWACTRCDARRFHSYRRDGPRSGRLVHWVGGPHDALRS
jgi:YfiH family protein